MTIETSLVILALEAPLERAGAVDTGPNRRRGVLYGVEIEKENKVEHSRLGKILGK